MRHDIRFANGAGASPPYNYRRIVLFLTLHSALHSFDKSANNLIQKLKLRWLHSFVAAILSSLTDPFWVPPTQTHVSSKLEHWLFFSLCRTQQRRMAQKSAVLKCVWVCTSKHADAAGQVLSLCSQKSFYLGATGKPFSNFSFIADSSLESSCPQLPG